MTTQEEVFTYLKNTYGNPRILFHAKVEELRKLGSCQGSLVKKRDWAIAVKARLVQLNDLAVDHGLQEELWFSPIVAELQASLPEKVVEGFKKLLKATDAGGNVSRKKIFATFFSYMDTVVQDFTFDVNYQLNNQSNQSQKTPASKPVAGCADKGLKKVSNVLPEEAEESIAAAAAQEDEAYTPPLEVQCAVLIGKGSRAVVFLLSTIGTPYGRGSHTHK